jgi:hypothetical protein
VAPAARSVAAAPLRTSSRYWGWLAGYRDSQNWPSPVEWPLRISAASIRFSKVPPEQPATTA